jgi:hypothetical protein
MLLAPGHAAKANPSRRPTCDHFRMDFGSSDNANRGAHPAVMTNDELLAEVTRLSQLLRRYAEVSTEVAKQQGAKIKALELEIQALKFSRDFETRMRTEQ